MDHDESQRSLAQLWQHAKDGCLTPWAQAKAWAIREVWKETKGSKTYGLCPHVAERVVKQGGGNPTKQAIAQLFEKMDAHTFGYGSFLGRGVVVCI